MVTFLLYSLVIFLITIAISAIIGLIYLIYNHSSSVTDYIKQKVTNFNKEDIDREIDEKQKELKRLAEYKQKVALLSQLQGEEDAILREISNYDDRVNGSTLEREGYK